MCDYSLEMYRSRPAVSGEKYETYRFPSGSIGFVAPGDFTTAICVACDCRLELHGIPIDLRQRLDVDEASGVTFVRIEEGPHHDGVRFRDGTEVTLQRLGPGVSAVVIDALTRPLPSLRKEIEEVEAG